VKFNTQYSILREELVNLCEIKHHLFRGRRKGKIERRVQWLKGELRKIQDEKELRLKEGE
jgi:hypothetical protein